ncbi:hypothetical protein OOT00_08395 [Desulfobotulus sp. H1]|uniref:Uncharacterized protein n=1 Tax=Desulfobotulus pelophilus TaxID=2823377 RepID=A0ABT3N983_9BACT|nr:hypothetical protein [Desulfobotulus pelophilus]MCW7754004.1 hypothetical protein [Desulfobotulus pelophilus]
MDCKAWLPGISIKIPERVHFERMGEKNRFAQRISKKTGKRPDWSFLFCILALIPKFLDKRHGNMVDLFSFHLSFQDACVAMYLIFFFFKKGCHENPHAPCPCAGSPWMPLSLGQDP